MIETGNTFLMLKISTPAGVSFYDEHQKIIDNQGYVWFCQFGKCNLLVSSISHDGNYVMVKESIKNGNHKYILQFSEIVTTAPESGFPDYYKQVGRVAPLWFMVTHIYEASDGFESYFRLASSGNSLDAVYRSMCNSFYIQSTRPYQF